MNALEEAYWAGARDATATIYGELVKLHGRPACRERVLQLLAAVEGASSESFRGYLREFDRGYPGPRLGHGRF